MYQLGCNCCEQYISETKKPVLTQSIDHQVGGLVDKCGSSGTTDHREFECLHLRQIQKFMRKKNTRVFRYKQPGRTGQS